MRSLLLSFLFCFCLSFSASALSCHHFSLPDSLYIPCNPGVLTASPNHSDTAHLHYLWSNGDSTETTAISSPGLYWLEATDDSGCVQRDSVYVLNESFLLSMSPDTILCESQGVWLHAGWFSGAVYTWSGTGTILSVSGDSALVYADSSHFFTASVSIPSISGLYCVYTDSIQIQVLPKPRPNLTSDSLICLGDSSHLSSDGGLSYHWEPASDLVDANVSNPIAFPSVSTLFTAFVTDSNACVGSGTVMVWVRPMPTLSMPDSVWVPCSSGTGTIIPVVTGDVSYLWSTGDTSSSLIVSVFGSYGLTVTDVCGYTATGSSFFYENDQNIILLSDTMANYCNHGPLTIIPGITAGTTPVSYYWSTGDITSSLQTDSFGQIWLQATDISGCVSSDTVFVMDSALTITVYSDTAICAGNAVPLSVSTIDHAVFDWTSSGSGSLSPTGSGTAIAIPDSSQWYSISIEIPSGSGTGSCLMSRSVYVNVNPIPVPIIIPDTSTCPGDSVELFASGGSTYLWSPGSSLSDSLSDHPMAFPSVYTTYTVWVSDALGCTGSGTVNVSIVGPPINDLPDSTYIRCGSGTAILSASGTSFADFYWSTGETNDSIFVSETGSYWLMVTNRCGMSVSDTIQVGDDSLRIFMTLPDTFVRYCEFAPIRIHPESTPDPLLSYQWSTGDVGSELDVSTPGSYWVIATDFSGCSNSDTTYLLDSTVHIDFSGDTNICNGTAAQVSASAIGWADYTWSTVAPSVIDSLQPWMVNIYPPYPENYLLDVELPYRSGSGTCTEHFSGFIYLHSLPPLEIDGDTLICEGESLSLHATGASSYHWIPGSAVSDSSSGTVTVHPSSDIMLYLLGSDSFGCENIDSIQIRLKSPLRPDLGPDFGFCRRDSIAILDAGTDFISYSWSNGVHSETDTINSGGSYWVITTDTQHCSASDTVMVSLSPANMDSVWSSGDSLHAMPGAVAYQWLNCDSSYALVSGANSELFVPSFSGHYAVALFDGYCVDTSLCTEVVISGWEDKVIAGLQIQPNPASDYCLITSGEKMERIRLLNALGQLISEIHPDSRSYRLPLKELPSALYYLQIKTAGAEEQRTLLHRGE